MRRIGSVVLVVLCALVPGAPAESAGTSSVLGQTTYTELGGCGGVAPFATVLNTSGGGASYTVAAAGVITSWSTVSGSTAGSSRLLLFVNGATPNQKTLVGKSDLQPIDATFGLVHTFPVRIPVQAGWQLGLGATVVGQACALKAGFAGDATYSQSGFNADTATAFTGTSIPTFRPNVSAVVESDDDADGYGDVSQDHCPGVVGTVNGCPVPDTTFTKTPPSTTGHRTVKAKFASTVAGSTFTCSLDGKPAKPCTSLWKKKVKVGKHTLVVVATSAAGVVDPTPVKAKFKVIEPS